MQLKIQRTQRMGGVLGGTAIFCLDVRAEYQPAEAENIRKYRLGSEPIYASRAARKHSENAGAHLDRTQEGSAANRWGGLAHGVYSLAMAKMNLNITIASLGKGQHIECKDLAELMEAEDAVMNACRNLRDYLNLAATFNGSIVLVDFSDGEKVHQSTGTLPLSGPKEYSDAEFSESPIDGEVVSSEPAYDLTAEIPFDEALKDFWAKTRAAYTRNPLAYQIWALIACALIVLSVWGVSIMTVLVAGGFIAAAFVIGRRRRGTL